MAGKAQAGKGMASGSVYVHSNVISVGGSGDRKRGRESSQSSYEDDPDVNVTRFLEAVSVNTIVQAIGEYNAAVVRCSCYSCLANNFRGANHAALHGGSCKLREAIIALLTKHGLVMYNVLEHRDFKHVIHVEFKKMCPNSTIKAVEIFPETDAHIVEMYRTPADGEAYAGYLESENYWRISGFGQRICDCVTLDDADITQWRDFVLELFSVRMTTLMTTTYEVLIPLFKILWEKWEQAVDSD